MLDKEEIRRLRAEAHHLKPEFQVGKDGLNPALIKQINEGFNTKELLKVKMLETSPDDRHTLALKLSELPAITLIQNIGHTYTLYKKMDEEKKAEKSKKAEVKSKVAKKRPAKKSFKPHSTRVTKRPR